MIGKLPAVTVWLRAISPYSHGSPAIDC